MALADILALIGGGALYYLQVYGYYTRLTPDPGRDVQLVRRDGGGREPIPYGDFQAIDADSSPIRYRACFTTDAPQAALRERFQTLPQGAPRVAPGWFDCFDAAAIGAGIEAGEIALFLSHKNIAFGVDRVVAIAPDGRGWAWHELNNCGRKAFDGTVVGEECPPRPARKAQ